MLVQTLAKTGTFLGSFTVSENEIRFHRALTHSEYLRLGNIVYFMFVNDRLMKIGIAGGQTGWVSRYGMYNLGERGDSTNRRILRVMKELDESQIEVYAVQCPKQKITFTCPLTGVIIEDEVEIIRLAEQHLTKQYLNESAGNELLFSRQLT